MHDAHPHRDVRASGFALAFLGKEQEKKKEKSPLLSALLLILMCQQSTESEWYPVLAHK